MQVLTLSVVLASIAMMLIQWQYGRYVTAYRFENSNRGRQLVEAALASKIATWNASGKIPPEDWEKVSVNDPVLGSVDVHFFQAGTTLNGEACPLNSGSGSTPFCAQVTVD